MLLQISGSAKQNSTFFSQHHLLCSLFLLMASPPSLPPRLEISLLSWPLSLSLPPRLPNNLFVVNSAFLLPLTSVPSSVPIAAALIQVLISSCWDCSNNLPNGLSSSLKSVLHIRLICLKHSFIMT